MSQSVKYISVILVFTSKEMILAYQLQFEKLQKSSLKKFRVWLDIINLASQTLGRRFYQLSYEATCREPDDLNGLFVSANESSQSEISILMERLIRSLDMLYEFRASQNIWYITKPSVKFTHDYHVML